jgi:MFS family permease
MTTIAPKPAGKKQFSLRPTSAQARFAFAVLFSINVLNYADRYVLSAILPAIKAEFHMSDFEGGLLISSFLLVYAVATLPLGIWADRGVRKHVISICVGIWSVATGLAGFAQNLVQLFALRSILGIGEAGYAPASLSLLGDLFSREKRGRILSYWSIGTLIGAAIGVSLGGLVADKLGWRWAFYLVGIPGMIAALLAWRLKEPIRGIFDHDEQRDEAQSEEADAPAAQKTQKPVASHGSFDKNFWASARQLAHIPTYWVLICAFIFSFFTIGGTSFWLTTYLTRAFSLSLTDAGSISGLVLVISGLAGTLIGGWLADRIQQRFPEGRLFTSALGFLLGAPLVLLALLIHTLPAFIAVFVIAAISLNFCTGPLNAVIQDVITPTLRATAVGLSLLLAHLLGDAAAPTIIGFISDRSSLGTALLATAPTFLFLAGLVCLIGLRTVRRDMERMQQQLHTQ